MTEKQKKDLVNLWNWLTNKCNEKRKAIESAKRCGEKRDLGTALRDDLAERTGVEAAVLTLGYCFIKDKNENATGIEKLGREERMCWMK